MFLMQEDRLINIEYVKKVEFEEIDQYKTRIKVTTHDGVETFEVGGNKKDAKLRFTAAIGEKFGLIDFKTYG